MTAGQWILDVVVVQGRVLGPSFAKVLPKVLLVVAGTTTHDFNMTHTNIYVYIQY